MKAEQIEVGTIKTRAVSALSNELVINFRWKEKDYMEWDHFEKDYPLDKDQWDIVLKKNLINKQVTFKVIKIKVDEVLVEHATIVFPPFNYTEEEVEALVNAAWTDGFYTGDTSGRHVAKRLPSEFWEENKKK